MRRFSKSVLGVTLLEIMLVLAIAAMIIVMSVRYYQSANTSQQANAILTQLQAITAAADSLAQATGSYSQGGVSTSTIQNILPNGASALTSPWNSQITVTGANTNTYTVTVPTTPPGVCPLLVSKLYKDPHYTKFNPSSPAGCSSSSVTLSYTYLSNP